MEFKVIHGYMASRRKKGSRTGTVDRLDCEFGGISNSVVTLLRFIKMEVADGFKHFILLFGLHLVFVTTLGDFLFLYGSFPALFFQKPKAMISSNITGNGL